VHSQKKSFLANVCIKHVYGNDIVLNIWAFGQTQYEMFQNYFQITQSIKIHEVFDQTTLATAD
jgi:hypothetical protein